MTAADPPGTIVSLQRGLAILRCFRHETGPLSMPEIAIRTALPKPTANRLLYTLQHLGCVEKLGNGHYRPGPRTMTIGRSLPLRDAARPFMQALAERHDVSVALAAPQGTEMIYLEYCVGAQTTTLRLRVGSVLPMGATVMGRAYAWALNPEARGTLLAVLAQEAGENAPALDRAMHDAFAELEQHGFCTSATAWRHEVFALGAPLTFNNRQTVLALTCAAPALRRSEKTLREDCGQDLLRTAAAIRNALGAVDMDGLGIGEDTA
jgi:DNA-binding IclR family transcriptional regulator